MVESERDMKSQAVYCQPRFRRGTGFGNRLFCWARCRVYSHEHSAQMISPIWVRPATGQFAHGGIDYKSYFKQIVLLGLIKRREGDTDRVAWLQKTPLPWFCETL
jgi:hypothetical protein